MRRPWVGARLAAGRRSRHHSRAWARASDLTSSSADSRLATQAGAFLAGAARRTRLTRMRPGPTSRNVLSGLSARTCCTASAKRTVSRSWAAHQCGSVASASVSGRPVRPETMGMVGADRRTRDTARSKGETAGSIMAEWKACEVFSRWLAMPSASSCCASASMAASGPATTQASGALMVAIDSSEGSRGATLAAGCRTASMAPAGKAWMSWPRRATSRAASATGITPAMTAAVNSPRL